MGLGVKIGLWNTKFTLSALLSVSPVYWPPYDDYVHDRPIPQRERIFVLFWMRCFQFAVLFVELVIIHEQFDI